MTDFYQLPRTSLGFFPTPLVALPRLSKVLGGPQILMKRDDLTGLALGGNKTRKLEYLVADALRHGADTLITGGASQSNHCRQTAAAAAMSGMDCHLALGGQPPEQSNGNLLLDELLSAHIHWSGEFRKGENIPDIYADILAQGRKPYIIPYGGSNELGAAGFINAIAELNHQLEKNHTLSHIVFASSSGGTHAGMMLGKALHNNSFELIGINIDKGAVGEKPLKEQILTLANRTAKKFNIPSEFQLDDITLNDDYLGAGYGVISQAERDAIALVAKYEGIFLDPIYSGRAMAGLIDMIKRNKFGQDEQVLFWHTGGAPAIFEYAPSLTSELAWTESH